MINSFHPVILAAVIGAGAALAALVVAWLVRSSVVKAMMILMALVFMVPAAYVFVGLNPGLFDSRFRTYQAFYKDIELGMTREQVLTLLERHYPADGSRKRPKILNDTPDALGFFMNPETSTEPNCEGIFLTLEGGRVTKRVYSAD